MGIIEAMYVRTMALLETLGQSQYQAVAADLAQTTQIISALVVVLVLINMGLQIRPMEVGSSVWLIFKLVLVALFMRSWSDFNGVVTAIEAGFEALGNSLLSGALGLNQTVTSFPRELDNLSENFGEYANVTAGRMNILGSVINGLMVAAIAFFGALATLAMIASRVVLAVFIGLAPLAIMATLTAQTKSYFETWLSAVIKLLMFPLILIGIFATILGMGNATIEGINPNEITALGQVVPILTILVLSSFLIMLSPFIVIWGTGDFQMGGIVKGVMNKMGGMGRSGPAKSGGSAPSESNGSIGRDTNARGGAMRNEASSTGEQVNSRADGINRAAARMERLRRK